MPDSLLLGLRLIIIVRQAPGKSRGFRLQGRVNFTLHRPETIIKVWDDGKKVLAVQMYMNELQVVF